MCDLRVFCKQFYFSMTYCDPENFFFNKPWFDQVRHREQSTENNANPAHHYIRNTQERVLSSHNRSGGYDDGFRSPVNRGWEV